MSTNIEWWRGAVIYQIYPRSFMDANDDGIGDLAGIASKMDYIASLNVDAIWISPFFKSPMKDFGYDISDYRDVDPQFGTLDDFRTLLDEAHKRGLKVLLDQVWSHTSDQHIWFTESRQDHTNEKQDWYIWCDPKPDGTVPNNWLSLFGGPAWTWDTRRQQYYLHHFLKEQPALNLYNPAVREEIKNTARFWFDMGVDGFRLDVINCAINHPDLLDNPPRDIHDGAPLDLAASNPLSRQHRIHGYAYLGDETFTWLNELRSVADEYEGRFYMGEIGGDKGGDRACEFIKTNKRLHSAYSFSMTGKTLTKDLITNAVNTIESNIEDGWMTMAVGNHDNPRYASSYPKDGVNRDYTLMGMALLHTLRGSVCLYQGEELGLPSAKLTFEELRDPYDITMYPNHMQRDEGRTPLPWKKNSANIGFSAANETWIKCDRAHAELAIDQQDTDPNSILNMYRVFLSWRKSQTPLIYGDIEILENDGNTLAFHRHHNNETMLCVFNMQDSDTDYKLPQGTYNLDAISRNASQSDDTITLKAFGYAFLKAEG